MIDIAHIRQLHISELGFDTCLHTTPFLRPIKYKKFNTTA